MRSGGALVHGGLCHLAAGGALKQQALGHLLCGCQVLGEVAYHHFTTSTLRYVDLVGERKRIKYHGCVDLCENCIGIPCTTLSLIMVCSLAVL